MPKNNQTAKPVVSTAMSIVSTAAMPQVSSPNFLIWTFVNADGTGDLKHWKDNDEFLKSIMGDSYRPLRVVLCDHKQSKEYCAWLKKQGYSVSIDSMGSSSKPGISSIGKVVYVIEIDFFKIVTKLIVLRHKPENITDVFMVQTRFIEFCKKIKASMLNKIAFFIFVSLIPFGAREPKNYRATGVMTGESVTVSIDLALIKQYFPHTKFIALPEHGSLCHFPPEVMKLPMGFGKGEYGIKLWSCQPTSVEQIITILSDKKLVKSLQAMGVEAETSLFVPIYIKDIAILVVFIQSLIASSLLAGKARIIFYISGCQIDPSLHKEIYRQLGCSDTSEQLITSSSCAVDQNKKVYIIHSWETGDTDYDLLRQLGSLRGGVGGCAGDVSFENLMSLSMLPFYPVPTTEKFNVMKSLMSLCDTNVANYLAHVMLFIIHLGQENDTDKRVLICKEYIKKLADILTWDVLVEWQTMVKSLRTPFNYYSHLIRFFNNLLPGVIAEVHLQQATVASQAYQYRLLYKITLSSALPFFKEQKQATDLILEYANPIYDNDEKSVEVTSNSTFSICPNR